MKPKASNAKAAEKSSAFHGLIGVARASINPPRGMPSRNWGASKTILSQGLHREMTATVITFQNKTTEPPLVLIGLDLGWWRNQRDEAALRFGLLKKIGIPESHLMINLSHTHSGPSMWSDESHLPGGDQIAPYLKSVQDTCAALFHRALKKASPALLDWRYGKCSLAQNRDLIDPQNPKRYLCGYNPDASADETLLVGRISADSGKILGTIINYACHPTVLAWKNRFISPDWVGAMREIVEEKTGKAPSLFLQGASGELGARDQYTDDLNVADQCGREVGYAVLATLTSMPPAGTVVALHEVMESGAPLAIWKPIKAAPSTELKAAQTLIRYQLKPSPDSLEKIQSDLKNAQEPYLQERLRRRIGLIEITGTGKTCTSPLWIWKLGGARIVGQPNETYSLYQTSLRKHFKNFPVVVTNLTNGSCGYLPPRSLYSKNIYQVWQSPFQKGSLEKLISTTRQALQKI